MMKGSIELLAPAGTMENFRAAIEAGADAIYLGGKAFNARRFAGNFDIEELEKAVRLAHIHGVRVFVTVNIIIADMELAELEVYLKELERIQVDALIVQDLAVARIARRVVPTMPLHGSTQMTVADTSGVLFLAAEGFTRVVLSRELSLEEIRQVCANSPIEIEVFVHGALCVSYSGQCLMSSFIGGRSGNRGACAQPCRLPYELITDKGEVVSDVASPYIMSLKDLNGLEELRALKEAGVASLKIEGRMKQSAYVYNVVSSYRKAIDGESKKRERDTLCHKTFNRGYTAGYLENEVNGAMATWKQGNNQSKEIEAVDIPEKKIPVYMTIQGKIGEAPILQVYDENGHSVEVKSQEYEVKEAQQRPVTMDGLRKQLGRLGDTEFVLAHIEFVGDENSLLPASVLNGLRREGIMALEEAILQEYPLERLEKKIVENVVPLKREKATHIGICVRTDTVEGIRAAGESGAQRCIYGGESYHHMPFTPELYKKAVQTAREYGMEIWLGTPRILRERERLSYKKELHAMVEAKPDGIAVAYLGALEEMKAYPDVKVLGDWPLNIFNVEAATFYLEAGCTELTVSPEMTAKQIRHLTKKVPCSVEVLVQGQVEMMVTEYCPIYAVKGKETKASCPRYCKQEAYALRDRKNEVFPLWTDQYCRVHIVNGKELNMLPYVEVLKKSGVQFLRIEGRGKDEAYIRWAVQAYREGLQKLGDLKGKEDKNSTRGHFFKGVL